MGEDQAEKTKPKDPIEMFRGMRDAYLDSMAKAMVDVVNTEGYAEATGAMLNNSLTMTAPFREAMEKSMQQVLQQLSLPSRLDIVALSERFTNQEMRLDDIDAKLDRIEKQTHAAPPAAQAAPAKPGSPKAKPEMQVVAKAPSTRRRTAAVKQGPPRRRAAKKGTRK
jgi:hypothetical protein